MARPSPYRPPKKLPVNTKITPKSAPPPHFNSSGPGRIIKSHLVDYSDPTKPEKSDTRKEE